MAGPERGPFFMGDRFGAVDIAFAPWAARFYILEHFRGFDWRSRAAAVAAATDAAAVERFGGWLRATLAHPSVVATLADRQRLLDSYRRYADDVTDSRTAQARLLLPN